MTGNVAGKPAMTREGLRHEMEEERLAWWRFIFPQGGGRGRTGGKQQCDPPHPRRGADRPQQRQRERPDVYSTTMPATRMGTYDRISLTNQGNVQNRYAYDARGKKLRVKEEAGPNHACTYYGQQIDPNHPAVLSAGPAATSTRPVHWSCLNPGG